MTYGVYGLTSAVSVSHRLSVSVSLSHVLVHPFSSEVEAVCVPVFFKSCDMCVCVCGPVFFKSCAVLCVCVCACVRACMRA